nr:BV-like protein [Cotesia vestalis bracovirus]
MLSKRAVVVLVAVFFHLSYIQAMPFEMNQVDQDDDRSLESKGTDTKQGSENRPEDLAKNWFSPSDENLGSSDEIKVSDSLMSALLQGQPPVENNDTVESTNDESTNEESTNDKSCQLMTLRTKKLHTRLQVSFPISSKIR